MAFVHSCWTETNNHSPALFEINTGMSRMGFPCVGAWVTYGLGTENQNLPAFVTMYDTLGRGLPKGHAQNWGAGFLPGIYQGTALNAAGRADRQPRPRRPTHDDAQQRRQLDLLNRLNQARISNSTRPRPSWPRASRASSWLTACRWPRRRRSTSARSRRRSSSSTASIIPKCTHFAKQCLMARRLVERGVPLRADLQRRHGERAELGRPHRHRQATIAQFAGETDIPDRRAARPT